MDLTELDPQGPYRLILDDSASRHIEYFTSPRDALARWAEFDAAMRHGTPAVDSTGPVH